MRLVLLSLCLLPSLLQAASFDCSRAEHPVELAICGNAALSELDERLAATFQRARGFSAEGDDSLLHEQRDWLRQTRQAIDDFAGGTQLGAALATLQRHHARRLIGRRTLVLLVSDGLDTGEPEQLARELGWLKRHSRALLWLNPLLRYDAYAPIARGAAQLHRAADGMLAVHNIDKLQDLAAGIAALLRQPSHR